MIRRMLAALGAAAFLVLALAPAAHAATTTSLLVPSGTAFTYLGRSCGGIQEQAFATGFSATGEVTGAVYLQTRCGGSGRGGGYRTTTYAAWVATTWSLTGTLTSSTRLAGAPSGLSPTFTATDGNGDQVANTLTAINVTPSACSVGNTAYCTYRAHLTTP